MNIRKWQIIKDKGIPHLELDVDEELFKEVFNMRVIALRVEDTLAAIFEGNGVMSARPTRMTKNE